MSAAIPESIVASHNSQQSFAVQTFFRYSPCILLQGQQLPSIHHDIYCNPASMSGGCSSLADWGRAVGMPARSFLTNSLMGALSQKIGGTMNLLHVCQLSPFLLLF